MKSSLLLLICVVFAACSFDYGRTEEDDESKPDIVMEDVEYLRIRGGDLTMRFKAEVAERYEERQILRLLNISFEQLENRGTEINAIGWAGEALVETDTGNARLSEMVRVEIDSEDVIIETSGLRWRDAEKELLGIDDDEVEILRSDGTRFTGRGFSANIRERTFGFTAGVEGTYVDNEDSSEEEEDDDDEDSSEEEDEESEASEEEEIALDF